jgi:hypothetical protein
MAQQATEPALVSATPHEGRAKARWECNRELSSSFPKCETQPLPAAFSLGALALGGGLRLLLGPHPCDGARAVVVNAPADLGQRRPATIEAPAIQRLGSDAEALAEFLGRQIVGEQFRLGGLAHVIQSRAVDVHGHWRDVRPIVN